MTDKYSLCEGLHPRDYSPWHIRELTDKGRRLKGGIDTSSLCGQVKRGRDLNGEVSRVNTDWVCKKCRLIYLKRVLKES